MAYRHIMLMFLSDVKTAPVNPTDPKSPRKVSTVDYGNLGKTKTTNESAIRYLLVNGWQGEEVKHIDRLFLFASAFVREKVIRAVDVPEVYGEEDRKRPMTHLEYFCHRLEEASVRNRLSGSVDDTTIYPYDENGDMDKAMEMTLDLSHRIQQFMDQHPDDEIILHADCTGGLRHANMMLLNVMRLLQYQKITVGKVLYSKLLPPQENETNRHGVVEEADEVYHMLDLVAGAEEFVRFGSITAIIDYFKGRKLSGELSALLHAMNTFAEEIKLCHRKDFRAAIVGLRESLWHFNETHMNWDEAISNVSSEIIRNDKLMMLLQKRIQDDYDLLLQEPYDDMKAVRWCLRHDYLQQAITLYYESFPEYIMKVRKIVVLSKFFADEIKRAYKKSTRKKNCEIDYYFIHHYFNDRDIKGRKEGGTYIYPIIVYIENNPDQIQSTIELGALQKHLETYNKIKNERILEDHAKNADKVFDSASDLKKYLENALDELESVH